MPGANEDNRRPDDVSIHHNDELVSGPEVDESMYENLPSLVDEKGKSTRPAKSADIADWVDHCVDLGADRNYLENDTEHVRAKLDENDQVVTEVEVHPALTKPQLIELADNLAG